MSPSSTVVVDPIAAASAPAATTTAVHPSAPAPIPDRPAARQATGLGSASSHNPGNATARDGASGRTPAQEAAALEKKERQKAKLRERKLAEAEARAEAQARPQNQKADMTTPKIGVDKDDAPISNPLLPFPIHVKLPMPASMGQSAGKPPSALSEPSAVRVSVNPVRPSEETAPAELLKHGQLELSVEHELAAQPPSKKVPCQPTESPEEEVKEQRRQERQQKQQQKQKEKKQRKKDKLAAAAEAGKRAEAQASSGDTATCQVAERQPGTTNSSAPTSVAAVHKQQVETESHATTPATSLLDSPNFLFAASAPPSSAADMADLYNEAGSRAIYNKSKKAHGEELTMRVSLKPLPGLAKLPPGGQQRKKYRQEMGVVEVQLKRKSHLPVETAAVSEKENREQKESVIVKLPRLPKSRVEDKTQAQPSGVRSSTTAITASPPLSRQHSHSVSRSSANSPHPYMHHHHKAASVSSTCPSTHVPTPPASVSSLSLAHASRAVVVSDEAEHDAAAATSPRDRLFSLTRSVLDDPAIVASHRTKVHPSMRATQPHAAGASQQEQTRKEQIRSEILAGSSSRRSSPVPGMNGLSLLAGVPTSGSGHITEQQAGLSSVVDPSTLPLSYQMPGPFPIGDVSQHISGFASQYTSGEPDAYQTVIVGQDGNTYVYVQDSAGSFTGYEPQLHYPHASPMHSAYNQYGQQPYAAVKAPRPSKVASLPTTIRPYDSPPVSPHQPSHQVQTHRFPAGYPPHFAHAHAQAHAAAYPYAMSATSLSSSLHLAPVASTAAAAAPTPISSGGVTYFMPAYAPHHAFAPAVAMPEFGEEQGHELYAGGAEADGYAEGEGEGEAGEADVAPDWNGGMFGHHPHPHPFPSQYIQPQHAYVSSHLHPQPPQQSHYPYPTFYYHSQHKQAHGQVQY